MVFLSIIYTVERVQLASSSFSGMYAGIKFFIIDFIFKRCSKLRQRFDTPYVIWTNLPTDLQLKERNNTTMIRRVSKKTSDIQLMEISIISKPVTSASAAPVRINKADFQYTSVSLSEFLNVTCYWAITGPSWWSLGRVVSFHCHFLSQLSECEQVGSWCLWCVFIATV